MPVSDDDPARRQPLAPTATASPDHPDHPTFSTLPALPAGAVDVAPDTTDAAELSRQELAFTLYCQGERTAAIAARLGVTARTVRGWLSAARAQIARDREQDACERLLRAIESHRAIASSAWEAYQQERQLERDLLAGKYDHIRRRSVRRVRGREGRSGHTGAEGDEARSAGADAGAATGTGAECDDDTLVEEYARPRHASQAARFLAVALNAQREVARLEGLYRQVAEPLPPAQIIITRRPDGPENVPPPDEDE